MSTMIREVYEAFKAAGVPDEKASAAAEALSQTQQERRIATIESDLRLLKWMVGFNLALTAAVLLKLLAT